MADLTALLDTAPAPARELVRGVDLTNVLPETWDPHTPVLEEDGRVTCRACVTDAPCERKMRTVAGQCGNVEDRMRAVMTAYYLRALNKSRWLRNRPPGFHEQLHQQLLGWIPAAVAAQRRIEQGWRTAAEQVSRAQRWAASAKAAASTGAQRAVRSIPDWFRNWRDSHITEGSGIKGLPVQPPRGTVQFGEARTKETAR